LVAYRSRLSPEQSAILFASLSPMAATVSRRFLDRQNFVELARSKEPADEVFSRDSLVGIVNTRFFLF
jgi:hypothetical protein